MNIAEYIESGILENYVLGTLSDQERQEVECMSHIYPEINIELERLHQSVESLSDLYQTQPPESLKADIMSSIEGIDQETDDLSVKVVPIQNNSQSISMVWRVAAIVAIMIAASLGVLQYNTSNELDQLVADFESYKSDMEIQSQSTTDLLTELQTNMIEKDEMIEMIKNPSTMKVKMTGTPGHDDMEAIVFCDMETDQIYMASNNFPTPPEDMGYQLWAIIDGVPVDMGMVDLAVTSDSIQKMSVAKNVVAFAVTLETKNGSPSPTMEQMIAHGNV